jgi:hypothetical protein
MNISAFLLAATATLTTMTFSEPTRAQEAPKGPYIYATYFICDVSAQERADEILQQTLKPTLEAAVNDGSLLNWGWLAQYTGGHWRRAMYYSASSMATLLATEAKIVADLQGKNKKLGTEFDKICNSHDDYVWRAVAGSAPTVPRGGASFSTYFVCQQTREEEADAIVKQVFAPIYDKLVAEGKLKSWGWNEHVVGAEYRRLATLTAADVPTLMATRASIVESMQKNPLGRVFDGICGSHADYIWEIKSEQTMAK